MKHSKTFVKTSASSISVSIKHSRIHLIGFVILGLVLTLAIFQMQYDLFVLPILLYYLYHHFQQHFGSQRVHQLVLQPDGNWTLNTTSNYQLLKNSSIRRYWAILYFKPNKMVAIFPDSMGKEEFRRVRVLCLHPPPAHRPNQY